MFSNCFITSLCFHFSTKLAHGRPILHFSKKLNGNQFHMTTQWMSISWNRKMQAKKLIACFYFWRIWGSTVKDCSNFWPRLRFAILSLFAYTDSVEESNALPTTPVILHREAISRIVLPYLSFWADFWDLLFIKISLFKSRVEESNETLRLRHADRGAKQGVRLLRNAGWQSISTPLNMTREHKKRATATAVEESRCFDFAQPDNEMFRRRTLRVLAQPDKIKQKSMPVRVP